MELGAAMPCTSALVGSMKARCPNMAAEVGRDSAGGRRASRGQLKRMDKHDEVNEEQEEVESSTENSSQGSINKASNNKTPLAKDRRSSATATETKPLIRTTPEPAKMPSNGGPPQKKKDRPKEEGEIEDDGW